MTEEKTKSTGKRVFLVILAIVLLAAIGGGIYWYMTRDDDPDSRLTDVEVVESVIKATRVFDNIARDSLNNNTSSTAVASNIQSNLISSTSDVEQYDFGDFYQNTFAAPGQFLSIADFILKNGTYTMGVTVFSNSAEDGIWYMNIESLEEGIIKCSIKNIYDSEDYDYIVDCIYYIDYDLETEKLNDFKLFYMMSGDTNNIVMLHLDVAHNRIHEIIGIELKDKTYTDFVSDASNNLVDVAYMDNYFDNTYLSVMFAEVNFENNKLSRWDGQSISAKYTNESEDEDIDISYSTLSQSIAFNLTSEISHFGKILPGIGEYTSSIDTDKAERTYLIEDALNYSMTKYEYQSSVDENGNVYYISNLKTLEEQKTEFNAIYNIVSNDRPVCSNMDFQDAELGSVKDARLSGLVGSIREYLNSKSENTYAGLTNVTYGNYKFNVSITGFSWGNEYYMQYANENWGEDFPDMAIVKVYAKYTYGDATYMELQYYISKTGEVKYISFRAITEEGAYFGDYGAYVSRYVYYNFSDIKIVDYISSTDYSIYREDFGDNDYPYLSLEKISKYDNYKFVEGTIDDVYVQSYEFNSRNSFDLSSYNCAYNNTEWSTSESTSRDDSYNDEYSNIVMFSDINTDFATAVIRLFGE